MNKSLKNVLLAFFCTLLLLITFARQQVLTLIQKLTSFDHNSLLPTWVTLPVIPQALLDQQFYAQVVWTFSYLFAIAALIQLAHILYCVRHHTTTQETLRQPILYGNVLLLACAALFEQNFNLYQHIVSTSGMIDFNQLGATVKFRTTDILFVAVLLLCIVGNFFEDDQDSTTSLIVRNFVLLPLATLGTAIYVNAPTLALGLIATHTCVALFFALNCYQIPLTTVNEEISPSFLLLAVVIACVAFMPTSRIYVTGDYEKTAKIQAVEIKNEKITAYLTIRDLNGHPKRIKVRGYEEDLFLSERPFKKEADPTVALHQLDLKEQTIVAIKNPLASPIHAILTLLCGFGIFVLRRIS